MKNKFAYLIAVLMAFVLILTGCSGDIDGKYKGFSSGFNFTRSTHSTVMCAARSEKTEFDINNVMLDFYFGWYQEPPYLHSDSTKNSFMVLYFCKAQSDLPMHKVGESDYRNIEDLYYLMDIPMQEYITDKYVININKSTGKVFSQSKNFTVPKDIFEPQKDRFWFFISEGFYSENDNTYSVHIETYMSIKYEYIDDNMVRLMKY